MSSYGVTVTQVNTNTIKTKDDYLNRINAIVNKAKYEGSSLVLLPQYTGVLLGAISNNAQKLEDIINKPLDREEFLELHSTIAKRNDIFICCGTNIEKYNERYYNTAYLISNTGNIILEQRQTHLTKLDKSLGLSRGKEISICKTDIGNIGIIPGTDKYYPEVSRIIALQGGDIALNPGGDFVKYSTERQLAGMWQIVQQNQFYGLESSFIGDILNKQIDGRCCVFAPCELTDGFTGFLSSIESGEVIRTVSIDTDSLKKPRTQFPIFKHFNVPLYKKAFPEMYRKGRG